MSRTILLVITIICNLAWARVEPLKKKISVEDPMGKFEAALEFSGDRPIPESIFLNLNVICSDLRKSPNAAQPQSEALLSNEKICAFDDYKFDKDSKILTLKFSTGKLEDEIPSCEEHWQQDFDLQEICEGWSAEDKRQPASEIVESQTNTDISARRRGVRTRVRVKSSDYYNSSWGQTNPQFDSNSLFSGSAVGTYPQQRENLRRGGDRGDVAYIGRDGLPRNSRREVVRCPHLGLSDCMSAIIAAESSCNTAARHKNQKGRITGRGLCASEIGQERMRFGSACASLASLNSQIECCKAQTEKSGRAYYGGRTVAIARKLCGW